MGLDPHFSLGVQAWYVMGTLFNGLVTIHSELNYVSDPAEFWDILEDGKVYVFHLLQAARSEVKGYVHLQGYKGRFEPVWLDRW